jgi:hypothetical protein
MLQSVIIIWQMLFWAISHVNVSLTSYVSVTNNLSSSEVVTETWPHATYIPKVWSWRWVSCNWYRLLRKQWEQPSRHKSHSILLNHVYFSMNTGTASSHQHLMIASSSPWNTGQELRIHMADHPRRLQCSNNYADYKKKCFSIVTGMLLQHRMWTHHKSPEKSYVYKFGKNVKSTQNKPWEGTEE